MNQITDQPQPAATAERNGYGTTSFVCGLVAAIVGLGPVIGAIFAFPLGAVGLSMGLANLGRLRSHKATNKRMTWAGIILSALGITFGVIGIVLFNHAMSKLGGQPG